MLFGCVFKRLGVLCSSQISEVQSVSTTHGIDLFACPTRRNYSKHHNYFLKLYYKESFWRKGLCFDLIYITQEVIQGKRNVMMI